MVQSYMVSPTSHSCNSSDAKAGRKEMNDSSHAQVTNMPCNASTRRFVGHLFRFGWSPHSKLRSCRVVKAGRLQEQRTIDPEQSSLKSH